MGKDIECSEDSKKTLRLPAEGDQVLFSCVLWKGKSICQDIRLWVSNCRTNSW